MAQLKTGSGVSSEDLFEGFSILRSPFEFPAISDIFSDSSRIEPYMSNKYSSYRSDASNDNSDDYVPNDIPYVRKGNYKRGGYGGDRGGDGRSEAESKKSHHASCHRCGNIRKKYVYCESCPQVFCMKCVDKMTEEHGKDCFSHGCPVCKKLCCCSEKTINCPRKYHCYKKCLTTKKGIKRAPPMQSSPPLSPRQRLDPSGHLSSGGPGTASTAPPSINIHGQVEKARMLGLPPNRFSSAVPPYLNRPSTMAGANGRMNLSSGGHPLPPMELSAGPSASNSTSTTSATSTSTSTTSTSTSMATDGSSNKQGSSGLYAQSLQRQQSIQVLPYLSNQSMYPMMDASTSIGNGVGTGDRRMPMLAMSSVLNNKEMPRASVSSSSGAGGDVYGSKGPSLSLASLAEAAAAVAANTDIDRNKHRSTATSSIIHTKKEEEESKPDMSSNATMNKTYSNPTLRSGLSGGYPLTSRLSGRGGFEEQSLSGGLPTLNSIPSLSSLQLPLGSTPFAPLPEPSPFGTDRGGSMSNTLGLHYGSSPFPGFLNEERVAYGNGNQLRTRDSLSKNVFWEPSVLQLQRAPDSIPVLNNSIYDASGLLQPHMVPLQAIDHPLENRSSLIRKRSLQIPYSPVPSPVAIDTGVAPSGSSVPKATLLRAGSSSSVPAAVNEALMATLARRDSNGFGASEVPRMNVSTEVAMNTEVCLNTEVIGVNGGATSPMMAERREGENSPIQFNTEIMMVTPSANENKSGSNNENEEKSRGVDHAEPFLRMNSMPFVNTLPELAERSASLLNRTSEMSPTTSSQQPPSGATGIN